MKPLESALHSRRTISPSIRKLRVTPLPLSIPRRACATGAPVVSGTRPVFSRPRAGDVLCSVNGAPLASLAIPTVSLVPLLQALPRPLKLGFIPAARRARDATDDRTIDFPEHCLRQVTGRPRRARLQRAGSCVHGPFLLDRLWPVSSHTCP